MSGLFRIKSSRFSRFTIIMVFLALTLALSGCSASQDPGDLIGVAIAESVCPEEPVPTKLTVTCHRVSVDGVSLSVAVLHAETPISDPVLFLHGGPGGRAVADRNRWLVPRSEQLTNHDIVLVDQRGGGDSRPSMDCPEMEKPGDQALAGDRSCRARLAGSGADVYAVTVGRIAADLVAVRRALEIDQWHLHGVSFGTRVALELMRTDGSAVTSVVLDSVVPPDVDETADLADGIVAAFTSLEEWCTNGGSCPSGVLAPLRRILMRLDENPVVVQVDESASMTVDDTAFLGAVVRTLGRADGPMAVPEAILLADTNHLAEAMDRLSPTSRGRSHAPENKLSSYAIQSAGDTLAEGAWVGVTCGDQLPGMDFEPSDSSDPIHRAEQGRWIELRARCAAWKVPPSDPITRAPISSSLPTLILAGKLDPITPVAWAKTVAEGLENSKTVIWSQWTHAPSTWNQCAAHLVARFFDTGKYPDDSRAYC
ncbi:MAG: alpha/beta hydrolase [Acidimicrobiales bacterium]|nr:alpha/beta hydrolase [Acidimicrobiales bacterium]